MDFSPTKTLERAMANATCYDEWRESAIAHDKKAGLERWKQSDKSTHFDHRSVRRRMGRLRKLRAKGDNAGLLFALNEGIHGNMDGMGHPALYAKAQFGTKQLIVDYIDEVASALEHLADFAVDDIDADAKLDFFHRAQHCFGRSTLMFSGAGSLLFFHLGVAKALTEHELLPRVLSGSSGGAFVSGVLCCHTQDELSSLLEPEKLAYGVEQESDGLFSILSPLKPSVASIDEVHEIIERLIPDLTFQQAFERTNRHLNVPIAPAETHQSSRLLNAITSPNVCVREAILASCAVPGVYPPVTLAAINDQGERQTYLPSRQWVDGSVSEDLPTKRLARLYGVNHFIVSQANPHILPFTTDIKQPHSLLSNVTRASRRTAREWINVGATAMARPLSWSPALNRITNIAISIINQDYVGDITIVPSTKFVNPMKVLAHRSVEEIEQLIAMGERATWPKVETIRLQTKVSRLLDRIVHDYEVTEGKAIGHIANRRAKNRPAAERGNDSR